MIVENHQDDEEMDLVDNNDTVIGRVYRTDAYNSLICNYRVVNAFLINSSNKIYIPIRSSNKRLFPNSYDFSVGGHVKQGESYLEALFRECKEELNIDLNILKVKEILYLNPHKDNVSSFMKIWMINYNYEIEYNTSDFCGANWLSFSEI